MRSVASILLFAWVLQFGLVAHAQERSPRAVHEAAAYASVRLTTTEVVVTGWLLAQGDGRPVVVTTRHQFCPIRPGVTTCPPRVLARVDYYRGASGAEATSRAEARWFSQSVDLAMFVLAEDPPPSARPLTLSRVDLARGDRVVAAGEPQSLAFVTVDATIAGSLGDAPGGTWCGGPGTCLVLDADVFAGLSGGVVLTREGRLAGMLWSPREAQPATVRPAPWVTNPPLAFAMHAQTIERELRAYAESRRADRP